jgi:thymidylate synthase
MYAINARNVAEALPRGLELLLDRGRREDSRAGQVIVMDAPVCTIYQQPRERVLFSAVRDANPFFHLAESLWMLAGRRDAEFPSRFVSDFAIRFGEEDGTIHDAYGWRWRRMLGFDQLTAVVQQLTEKPESRQAVIQMWDATPHGNPPASLDGMNDLLGDWRTRPCNTHAYLRIRNEEIPPRILGHAGDEVPVLDITVCCRSNDVVMGAYGANAVHFSILQEYLAAMLDVGVGRYYQFSNNYHVYQATLDMLDGRDDRRRFVEDNRYEAWEDRTVEPTPLVHDAALFDQELAFMLHNYDRMCSGTLGPLTPDTWNAATLNNHFLSRTAWPMLMAHYWHKRRDGTIRDAWLELIEASDWGAASREWIERRRR